MQLGRRQLLWTLGSGAALAAWGAPATSKPLRGVFPIGQTPFTPYARLHVECLQAEVKFCNRYKVHGFAWPKIASAWNTLSQKERLEGAEAILAAAKGGATAIVIGVQSMGNDLAETAMYVKHA